MACGAIKYEFSASPPVASSQHTRFEQNAVAQERHDPVGQNEALYFLEEYWPRTH